MQAATAALSLLAWGYSTPVSAYCQLRTGESLATYTCSEEGVPLAWKSRCISIGVFPRESDDPSQEEVLAAIDASFNSWTDVRCDGFPIDLEVKRLPDPALCDRPQHNTSGPNLNSIAFVADWQGRDNPPEAFALTSVWHDKETGEILDVDMEINDDPELAENLGYLGICQKAIQNTSGELPYCLEADLVDIQNVVTHEAGHFFGLGHSSEQGAVMLPQAETRDLSKRILKSDDVDGICHIYPPGILPEQCDFTPRNGLSLRCYQPEASSGLCSAVPGTLRGDGRRAIAGATFLCTMVFFRLSRRSRRS